MQQLPKTQNEYSELNDSCSRLNRGQPQTLKQLTSSLKVRQVVQMSLEWPK